MNSKTVFICLLGLMCLQLSHQANEFCSLPQEPGPCKAMFFRFYFDPATKSCKEFVYGGCGGNQNKFVSVEECAAACS